MKSKMFKKVPTVDEQVIYAVFQQEPTTLDEPLIGLFASEQQAKGYAANQTVALPEYHTSWEEIVVTLDDDETLTDGQILHLLISGQPDRAHGGLPDMFAEIEGAYTTEHKAEQALTTFRKTTGARPYSRPPFTKRNSQQIPTHSIADMIYIRPIPLGWHSESPWNHH